MKRVVLLFALIFLFVGCQPHDSRNSNKEMQAKEGMNLVEYETQIIALIQASNIFDEYFTAITKESYEVHVNERSVVVEFDDWGFSIKQYIQIMFDDDTTSRIVHESYRYAKALWYVRYGTLTEGGFHYFGFKGYDEVIHLSVYTGNFRIAYDAEHDYFINIDKFSDYYGEEIVFMDSLEKELRMHYKEARLQAYKLQANIEILSGNIQKLRRGDTAYASYVDESPLTFEQIIEKQKEDMVKK